MRKRTKYVIALVLAVSFLSCLNKSKPQVYMQTFREDGKWGYNILLNDKVYIHQDCIPALVGNKPFASEQEAALVGKLVLKKILNKETPTVNTGELKQLGIKDTS